MLTDVPQGGGRIPSTAQHLCQLLRASACSIYVHRRNDEQFVLSDTHTKAADAPARGLSPTFSARREAHLRPDGEWRGYTSFVAWSRQPLLVASVGTPQVLSVAGTQVVLQRDGSSCEIDGAASFLAAPVLEEDRVHGVVRLVRKSGVDPFCEADLDVLIGCLPWVQVSIAQAEARAELIRSLFDVVTTDDVDTMLKKIGAEASKLVGGEDNQYGILIVEPNSGHVVLYDAQTAPSAAATLEYTRSDRGLSAYILRTGRPFLSTDLRRNILESDNPASPLAGFVPTPKQEGYRPQMRSFVGVPIIAPLSEGGPHVEGVIRVSSRRFNAFSYHDLETLEALAQQTSLLMAHRHRLRTEERKFHALIKASPQPIVAVDRAGKITEFNDAAQSILGVGRDYAMSADVDVVKVVYGGNRALAGATRHAIHASGSTLRDHFTVFYRECQMTGMQIPIPVRLAASPLASEDNREILGSIGFFEDMRGAPSKPHITVIEADLPGESGKSTILQRWVTVDPGVANQFERVKQIARNPGGAVLVTGPTGAGKEAIARALHYYMQKESRLGATPGKFAALNCAGLNEQTLDVELFGAEPNMYTGGPTRSEGPLDGIIKDAENGTVFLDEIATLSLSSQAKLLRSLGRYGEVEVRRVGSGHAKHVKVQVVAATNEDLSESVRAGRFRADLYERLKGAAEFALPALIDRRADILLLAEFFLSMLQSDAVDAPRGFASEAVRVLLSYPWPGNIRELEYVVRSAAQRWRNSPEEARKPGRLIDLSYFPQRLVQLADGAPPNARYPGSTVLEGALSHRLALVERELDLLHRERDGGTGFRDWLLGLIAKDPAIKQRLLSGERGVANRLIRRAEDEGVSVRRTTAYGVISKIQKANGVPA